MRHQKERIIAVFSTQRGGGGEEMNDQKRIWEGERLFLKFSPSLKSGKDT